MEKSSHQVAALAVVLMFELGYLKLACFRIAYLPHHPGWNCHYNTSISRFTQISFCSLAYPKFRVSINLLVLQ
jgi:hypothetical protein